MKPRAEIEIAKSILEALKVEMNSMDQFWPKSKRGSNASRIWNEIDTKADAAIQCLDDALKGIKP